MFLANILLRTAQLHPGRTAIVHEGRNATWRETLDRVRRLAGALRAVAGPGQGCVLVLGESGPEHFELSFAVPMAGLVLVPINTRLSLAELRKLVDELDCRLIFHDARHADDAVDLAQRLDCPRLSWGDGHSNYEKAIAAAEPADSVLVDPETPWAIIYTGGTTGLPKGVVLSHRAITYNVLCILQALPWERGCRFLHVSPLFHLAGIGPSIAATALGGTHHFLPSFSVEGLLHALSEHRITCTNLVPTMIGWMLAHEDIGRYDLSTLRHLAYGASSISVPVLERLLARFPNISVTQFYGQTESCGGVTSLAAADHSTDPALSHRLASAGTAMPGARIAILAPDGTEVARGTWGEICALSDGLFSGYLGHEELTRETMRGGWLHTGDVGYMDDDGYVYVTDRLKDMIVTGGENVSSSEVETVIARFPGVLQVAVIAVPDDNWGERVHACLVVREEQFDTAALLAFCRMHIAGYKCPKSFTVSRDPLPVSAIGKVRKDLLRAEAATAAPASGVAA